MKKVLVVEDNRAIRELYRRLIEANGFSMVEVLDFMPSSVEKSFLFYRDEIFCVVSDYNIGIDLSGTDVVRVVRGIDRTILIFAICSYPEDGNSMITAGASRFFAKPVDMAELSLALREAALRR